MNKYHKLLCISGLLMLLVGCEEAAAPLPVETAAPTPIPTAQTTLELWQRSCALCHVDGNAGAPRIGNQTEWGSRLAKGPDVLLQNTLEGINQMPPLGYCMACERADFKALIDFMTDGLLAGTQESTKEETAQ